MINSIILEVRGGIVQQVNQYFNPEAKGGIYVLDWDNDDTEIKLKDGSTATCSFEEVNIVDVKPTSPWWSVFNTLLPKGPIP